MLASQRCGAKTRQDGSCKAPAVHGKKRCRMHGGAPGSGAPKENKNALKHGLFTKEAIEARRQMRALLRQSRKLLQDIRWWKIKEPRNFFGQQKSTFSYTRRPNYRLGWPERPSIVYFFDTLSVGFFKRAPAPPPFSLMNCIPDFSSVLLIDSMASSEIWRLDRSKSTIVDRPKLALFASWGCVISNNALAARHWAGVKISTFSVDMALACLYQHKMLIADGRSV
jgi:hypothetical protein